MLTGCMCRSYRSGKTLRIHIQTHTGSNGAKTLLSSGVPDLELDALTVELDGTDFEVNPDGGDERRGKGIVREAEEQAALSDAWKW